MMTSFPPLRALMACLWLAAAAPTLYAQSASPMQLQRSYEATAGAAGRPAQGQVFFTSRHGGAWSCATCHGQHPTGAGRHAVTHKTLDPLAPTTNPQAFTDARRAEKWFRRNCREVVQRDCTAAEKADVLAWLQTLR